MRYFNLYANSCPLVYFAAFIAVISVKNDVKPLKKSLRSFREIVQYVRDECLGHLSLLMAA